MIQGVLLQGLGFFERFGMALFESDPLDLLLEKAEGAAATGAPFVVLGISNARGFEEAKALEKDALDHGSPFTWSSGESLAELEQPERVAQIVDDFEVRRARIRASLPINPLRPARACPEDIDDVFGEDEGGGSCLSCHK